MTLYVQMAPLYVPQILRNSLSKLDIFLNSRHLRGNIAMYGLQNLSKLGSKIGACLA